MILYPFVCCYIFGCFDIVHICQYPAILGLNFLIENCFIDIVIVLRCKLYVVLFMMMMNDSMYYSKNKERETLLHIPQ